MFVVGTHNNVETVEKIFFFHIVSYSAKVLLWSACTQNTISKVSGFTEPIVTIYSRFLLCFQKLKTEIENKKLLARLSSQTKETLTKQVELYQEEIAEQKERIKVENMGYNSFNCINLWKRWQTIIIQVCSLLAQSSAFGLGCFSNWSVWKNKWLLLWPWHCIKILCSQWSEILHNWSICLGKWGSSK